MFKKLIGVAAAFGMTVGSAFAAEGGFEYWSWKEGDGKHYAVRDTETGKTASAVLTSSGFSIASGEEADKIVMLIEGQNPASKMKIIEDGDTKIIIDSDSSVEVIEIDGDDPAEIEKALKEQGVDVDVDINRNGILDSEEEMTGEKAHKTVIIKKEVRTEKSVTSEMEDPDAEPHKIIIIEKDETRSDAPVPPDAPDAPGMGTSTGSNEDENDGIPQIPGVDIPEVPGEVSRTETRRYEYQFSDDNGMNRSWVHSNGVSEAAARKFIRGIDGLTRDQRRKMEKALGL